jgi:hypothetical protein
LFTVDFAALSREYSSTAPRQVVAVSATPLTVEVLTTAWMITPAEHGVTLEDYNGSFEFPILVTGLPGARFTVDVEHREPIAPAGKFPTFATVTPTEATVGPGGQVPLLVEGSISEWNAGWTLRLMSEDHHVLATAQFWATMSAAPNDGRRLWQWETGATAQTPEATTTIIDKLEFLVTPRAETSNGGHWIAQPQVGDILGGGTVIASTPDSVTINFPAGLPTTPIDLPWVRTTTVIECSGSTDEASVGHTLFGGGLITDVTHIGTDRSRITVQYPGGVPSGRVELPGGGGIEITHPEPGRRVGDPTSPVTEPAADTGDQSEMDEYGLPTALISAAAVTPPPNWPGTLCDWIVSLINKFLNGEGAVKGLKLRHLEIRYDIDDLYHANPRPGPGSWPATSRPT